MPRLVAGEFHKLAGTTNRWLESALVAESNLRIAWSRSTDRIALVPLELPR